MEKDVRDTTLVNSEGCPDCDEHYCDKHQEEAEAEYRWMRNVSIGAITGVMSSKDEQDMRDAGRGHLVRRG